MSAILAYTLHIIGALFSFANVLFQLIYVKWIVWDREKVVLGPAISDPAVSVSPTSSSTSKVVRKYRKKTSVSEDASCKTEDPTTHAKPLKKRLFSAGARRGTISRRNSTTASKKQNFGQRFTITDKIWFNWSIVLFCNSCLFCGGIIVGFDRASFLENGVLGGPPSLGCKAQGVLIPMFSIMVSGYATMMSLQVYFSTVKGYSPLKMNKLVNYMHGYVLLNGIIVGALTLTLAQLGPLFMWCWIPCEETGLPSDNLNPGRCVVRITVYGPIVLNCLIAISALIPLIKMLFHHMKKTKDLTTSRRASVKNGSNSNNAVSKGFKKTVLFLIGYSVLAGMSSALRVRSSFYPNSDSEGKLGTTEFANAFIPIAGIMVFGIDKFYLPWKRAPYVVAHINKLTAKKNRQSVREKNNMKASRRSSLKN